jgi:hypothetical protein
MAVDVEGNLYLSLPNIETRIPVSDPAYAE